jgi:hypothetical protein
MAYSGMKLSNYLPVRMRNNLQIHKTIRDYKKCEKHFELLRSKDINSVPAPHYVKQNTIREYANRYGIKAFIETGTFLGIMVNSMKNEFVKVISIELSELLYLRAKKLFSHNKNIEILLGNSEELLPIAISNIKQPCLFWLDGHYSGGITALASSETPIVKEITAILNHPVTNHILLIDDARLFTGQRDYPTIDELKELLDKLGVKYHFEIKDDIIIIFRNDI